MATTKCTVTLPNGTKATRRTAHNYTHVIATRLDVARPSHDRVDYKYTVCDAGKATVEPFEQEVRQFDHKVGGASAWHKFWDEMWSRREPVTKAHAAVCPLRCDGAGQVRTETGRKPEPTGWMVVSWHHSLALAQKALSGKNGSFVAKGMDEVKIVATDSPDVTVELTVRKLSRIER